MMILIDIDMPKNCLECPAHDDYMTCVFPVQGRGWGSNDVTEYTKGRPGWCPMKELILCKDCKYSLSNSRFCAYPHKTNNIQPGDWFCADGEMKT